MARVDPRSASWLGFFAIVLVAWLALWVMAADHAGAASAGPAWLGILDPEWWLALCRQPLPPLDFAATAGMWVLMILAMMLPAALPVLKTYGDFPVAANGPLSAIGWWSMAAGHVSIWLGFAFMGALLQGLLFRAGLLTEHFASASGALTVALLAVAGLYQFSPLRAACLARCRSPMGFFIAHWQDGAKGAYRMGLRHGVDCLGCCWALMLLAFVGGTMNLAWMGLATALMLIEKTPALGRLVTAPLGIVLLLAAMLVGLNTWIT